MKNIIIIGLLVLLVCSISCKKEQLNADGVIVDAVTDYDGNKYDAVKIGNQVWMKENLRTTHYANGMSIILSKKSSKTMKYRYYPGGQTNNVDKYGYLYNWAAVMNGQASSNACPSHVQGICPNGWHVPSDEEWFILTDYVQSQKKYWNSNSDNSIGKALASTENWDKCDTKNRVGWQQERNNATNFTAMPAGMLGIYSLGKRAFFWSTTTDLSYPNTYNAVVRNIIDFQPGVYRRAISKEKFVAVRCVRD